MSDSDRICAKLDKLYIVGSDPNCPPERIANQEVSCKLQLASFLLINTSNKIIINI